MVRRGERVPANDEWKKVTLQHVQDRPSRLILECHDCDHRVKIWPEALSEKACLPMATPLFIIAQHLRCGNCGSRKVGCWPEPYRSG
jgi:hypothetical protein